MGLRPTQGDENALVQLPLLYETVALPFVIPTEAKRSGGICSSTDLSWKCFSTEHSRVERSAVVCQFSHTLLSPSPSDESALAQPE